jgi:hypothetical protein|tara:strand:- start:839 stop:1027 length:189 start_codon:yes stop_codon:yes gene_type:complete
MEIIGMKKKYSFTIEDRLMDWFRLYVREESTTMSATLNQHILSLKREREGYKKPSNKLKVSN